MGWGGEWVVQFFHTVNIYKLDPFGFYHFCMECFVDFCFYENVIYNFFLFIHT